MHPPAAIVSYENPHETKEKEAKHFRHNLSSRENEKELRKNNHTKKYISRSDLSDQRPFMHQWFLFIYLFCEGGQKKITPYCREGIFLICKKSFNELFISSVLLQNCKLRTRSLCLRKSIFFYVFLSKEKNYKIETNHLKQLEKIGYF